MDSQSSSLSHSLQGTLSLSTSHEPYSLRKGARAKTPREARPWARMLRLTRLHRLQVEVVRLASVRLRRQPSLSNFRSRVRQKPLPWSLKKTKLAVASRARKSIRKAVPRSISHPLRFRTILGECGRRNWSSSVLCTASMTPSNHSRQIPWATSSSFRRKCLYHRAGSDLRVKAVSVVALQVETEPICILILRCSPRSSSEILPCLRLSLNNAKPARQV